MQTPYLPKRIFGDDFTRVYEPAEDSFLLLDALEKDLDQLRENVSVCLECGSGSGVIITALALALSSNDATVDHAKVNRLLLATDLNWDACLTTRKCATYHKQESGIQVIRTNLAEALVDRLENSIDLLVFNPPYVPTGENETNSSKINTITNKTLAAEANQLHLSWVGGLHGRELIDRFLLSYVPRLLSKPNGVAFMIALDRNNPKELANFLVDKHKIYGKIVMERQAGIEHLYVIRYEWLK